MRFLPLVLAALALAACGKPKPAPTPESRAVGEGLQQLCAAFLAPGAPKKIEAYEPKMKALGWEIDNPPGIYMFNKEGDWGRVRIALASDFHGGCSIRAWAPRGAAAHDGAASTAEIAAWAKANAHDAEQLADRMPAPEPRGMLRSEWHGGGWSIVVKELPVAGGRPVLQAEVKRGVL